MFIDTHCHLDCLEKIDINQAIENAKANQVTAIICIGLHQLAWQKITSLSEKFPSVFATYGTHPTEDLEDFNLSLLAQVLKHPKALAVGEIGLDYYREPTLKEIKQQNICFSEQITVASQEKKPIVVHTRAAKKDTLTHLQAAYNQGVRGVLHCFTEDKDMAFKAIDLGFYISFSGIITFKKAIELKELVASIPIEHLLIETDAPYLAPTPFRGKENQPAWVVHVAEEMARIKQISKEKVGEITSKNAIELFNLPSLQPQI